MNHTWKAASIAIAVGLLISLAGFASPLSADDSQEEGLASDRFIVQFEPGTSSSDMARVYQEFGGKLELAIPELGVQVVSVPHQLISQRSAAYRSDSRVRCVEPDYAAQAVHLPNDPYFNETYQWGMFKVEAPEAWDITHGSRSVRIAILDTGIDRSHPDLRTKVVANKDFTGSGTAKPVNSHGTHVAGIAGAITNNRVGVAGLGYSSSLMDVKVLGDNGTGYYSWIAQGIVWATDNGADVINLSLGGSSPSSTLKQAVDYAWNHGVVVVAAAGNDGSSSAFYPAYYGNCIAVGATDASDRLSSWSNRGSWVDVAAPGTAYSTKPNNQYGNMGGTSIASPHVAGLAGLVSSVASDTNHNARLNDEVRSRIENGCDDVGINVGHGRINAYQAVRGLSSPPSPSQGQISGKVTDAGSGKAISGATVSNGKTQAATDSRGSYTICGVSQGTYTVTASAAGYQGSSSTVAVYPGRTAAADFSLAGEAPAATTMWVEGITFTPVGPELQIKVSVVNTGPVEGARVRLNLKQNGKSVWNSYAITGSDGEATYRWPQAAGGEYLATVSRLTHSQYTWDEGRGISSASYTPGSEPPSTHAMWVDSITFSPAGSELQIKVKVLNSEPVVGATVRLDLKQDGRTILNASSITGSAGEATYCWQQATGGEYLATVTQLSHIQYTWDGNQGISSASYTLASETPSNGTMWVDSVTFTSAGSMLGIKVKVVSPGPVAGARVRLNLKQDGKSIWDVYTTTSSAGEAAYRWPKAVQAEYLATITCLSHDGYTWDKSRGISSASYITGTQPVAEAGGIADQAADSEATNSVSSIPDQGSDTACEVLTVAVTN